MTEQRSLRIEQHSQGRHSSRAAFVIILRILTGLILIIAVLFFGGIYEWLGNLNWFGYTWRQHTDADWTLKLNGVDFYLGNNWSLFVGSFLALLWCSNLVPAVRGLDDRIQAIGEQHRGPKRYKKVLKLSIWLTLWLWGVGLFVGVAGASWIEFLKAKPSSIPVWIFPWEKLIDPGILIGTLLGTGTIFALILAFAEVREHLTPRAMSFKDALKRSTQFINKWREEDCSIVLCAYYPFIGAVNQASYQEEYNTFCDILKTEHVKCVCLTLTDDTQQSSAAITALGKDIEGKRPVSIQQAIAAFANMWYGQDPLATFQEAIKDIRPEFNYLRDKHDLLQVSQFVPDFHFLLAIKETVGTPSAAFILIPLRPAGMPATESRERPSPPMVGMEVHDADILRGLLDLYNSLPRANAIAESPPC